MLEDPHKGQEEGGCGRRYRNVNRKKGKGTLIGREKRR